MPLRELDLGNRSQQVDTEGEGYMLKNDNGAPSITKYGLLVRPDAQIVAQC